MRRTSITNLAVLACLLTLPGLALAAADLQIVSVHLHGDAPGSSDVFPNLEVRTGEVVHIRVHFTNAGADPAYALSATWSTRAPVRDSRSATNSLAICGPRCTANLEAGVARFTAPGDYDLEVRLHDRDHAGDLPASQRSVRIRVRPADATPPTLWIGVQRRDRSGFEAEGTCIWWTPVLLGVYATDTSGVESIRYSITTRSGTLGPFVADRTNGALTVAAPDRGSAGYTFTPRVGGAVRVHAEATDAYGNPGSGDFHFDVAGRWPTLRIIPPDGGRNRIQPGRTNRLTAEVFGSDCPVRGVSFELVKDGRTYELGGVSRRILANTLGVLHHEAAVPALPPGPAELIAYVQDEGTRLTRATLATYIGDPGIQFLGPAARGGGGGDQGAGAGQGGSSGGRSGQDAGRLDVQLGQLERQLTDWQLGKGVPKGWLCGPCMSLLKQTQGVRQKLKANPASDGLPALQKEADRLDGEVKRIATDLQKTLVSPGGPPKEQTQSPKK